MRRFDQQTQAFLQQPHSPLTANRYASALREFQAWHQELSITHISGMPNIWRVTGNFHPKCGGCKHPKPPKMDLWVIDRANDISQHHPP